MRAFGWCETRMSAATSRVTKHSMPYGRIGVFVILAVPGAIAIMVALIDFVEASMDPSPAYGARLLRWRGAAGALAGLSAIAIGTGIWKRPHPIVIALSIPWPILVFLASISPKWPIWVAVTVAWAGGVVLAHRTGMRQ